MDLVEGVLTRRSIRRGFSDVPISQRVIAKILDCGAHAPSSKDDQPWQLSALSDRTMLSAIAERMAADPRAAQYVPVDPATNAPRDEFDSTVLESAEILRAVPVAIVVQHRGGFTGGRARLAATGASAEALLGFAFECVGIGAAIQNMWLCAHAEGLKGVFIGDAVIAEDFVRDGLSLRGDLVGLLALGYANASPHAPKRVRAR